MTEEKLKRVKEHITQSRNLHVIANRQKLIKVADHSHLGWAIVEEYTTDELREKFFASSKQELARDLCT